MFHYFTSFSVRPSSYHTKLSILILKKNHIEFEFKTWNFSIISYKWNKWVGSMTDATKFYSRVFFSQWHERCIYCISGITVHVVSSRGHSHSNMKNWLTLKYIEIIHNATNSQHCYTRLYLNFYFLALRYKLLLKSYNGHYSQH